MQSSPIEESTVKTDTNELTDKSFTGHVDSTSQEPIDVPSSPSSSSSSFLSSCAPDEDHTGNPSKQLVLYNPESNDAGETENVADPDPIKFKPTQYRRNSMPSRVSPSVGAFTVQCANCFKWRLIPTKEKYEEIREHIIQKPFSCETASEWRPDISCDDPADISQDGSRLWAIDKPSIAQPPSGWQRLLHIRGEGSTKFADVYYIAPTGKKLRSMVDVQKYLMENPEYLEGGVTISKFSFQTPRPLQEDYVRKRPARVAVSPDDARSIEPAKANPLAWVGPDDGADLQLGPPELPSPSPSPSPCFEAPDFDIVQQPPQKKARISPPEQ